MRKAHFSIMKGSKKMKRKITAIILSLALLLSFAPAVSAEGAGTDVYFAFCDGSPVIPKQSLNVYDGIAEEYGFDVAETDHNGNTIDGITVFDVIVAAHKNYYGDAFTPETAGNYLEMSYSFITKIFGTATSVLGFTVNDKMPNDGVYNESYGSYTGFACDTAEVADGGYVNCFTYQDAYWADYYPTLSEAEITVTQGEAFEIAATGYSIMYYGCSTEEALAEKTVPLEGIEVYSTTDFENYSLAGTLDSEGKINLTFDEAGTVFLCVKGTFEDAAMGKLPVVANWCEVTVEAEEIPEEPENPEETKPFWFPKGINFEINADSENGDAAITINLTFADLRGGNEDKTESIVLSVNVSWFSKIIEFIEGIIK